MAYNERRIPDTDAVLARSAQQARDAQAARDAQTARGGGIYGTSSPAMSGGVNIGSGITCNCGGTHSVTSNRDGSSHVVHRVDGAHFSCDVQKDGTVTNAHGTIHDVTGQGNHIIVEAK